MEQGDKLKVEIAAEETKAAATKESIARQLADLEAKGKRSKARLEELKKERATIAEQD